MSTTPGPAAAGAGAEQPVVRSAARSDVVARVVDHLLARDIGHPLRVAVDGITAAGKTTWAVELAAAVRERGRPAVHLSMDGFHHPSARRHREGRTSAVGYYRDAYDFAALARSVLVPLGPDGNRRYRARVHDLAADQPTDDPPQRCPPDAVVVVDGTFLQTAELAPLWDDVVFLDVGFDVARARGIRRDGDQLGGRDLAGELYDRRYHAAARLYLADVDPRSFASVVVGNDEPQAPELRRITSHRRPATAPLA